MDAKFKRALKALDRPSSKMRLEYNLPWKCKKEFFCFDCYFYFKKFTFQSEIPDCPKCKKYIGVKAFKCQGI